MHFRLIKGSGFDLNITDTRTQNEILLNRITDDYNGKTIKTGSSSVLGIYFYSKGSNKVPANLEMIVLEDQGSFYLNQSSRSVR